MTAHSHPTPTHATGAHSRLWHVEHGSGTPLVMIHGYTADHRLLLPLEGAFKEKHNYRRLYLDLPGHGNSPRLPGPTSADALTDAVVQWINATIGDEPFGVIGQSFGGQIARAVTARYGSQVIGAALLAPVVMWGDERTLPTATTITHDHHLLRELPEEERGLFSLVMANIDHTSYGHFKTHLMPGWRAHDRSAANELEANFLLTNQPEQNAPTHNGPHLLLTGRQDALVGWEDQLKLLEHYPRMSAVVIDGAGHNPQLEATETVNNHITRWLDLLNPMKKSRNGTTEPTTAYRPR